MTARTTIYDDNGYPKGVYELKPSRIYNDGISTKYVFEFEYNKLNLDEFMRKTEPQDKSYDQITKEAAERM